MKALTLTGQIVEGELAFLMVARRLAQPIRGEIRTASLAQAGERATLNPSRQ